MSGSREPLEQGAFLDLKVEITRITFHKFAPTAFVSAIGTVGASALLADRFHDPWLWRSTTAMIVVCALRISLPLAFERRRNPALSLAAARRWQMAHSVVTALNCCNLAASTLYNFRYHDHTAQFICTLGVFILCTGMGASFGMPPWAAQFCGLSVLGALAFSIFQQPDPLLARTGCAMIGLFALVYCKLVKSKYDMVVEQLRLKRTMSHLADHDALTGLPNRRQFEVRLTESCRHSQPFAVLFLDLDGFKKVNDVHGHAMGDALLQRVAGRLKDAVRNAGIVSRLGGDEFAILLHASATRSSTEALAGSIIERISAPYIIEGQSIQIGTSIGIQLSAPGSNDPNRLLSEADAALYDVKQSGKGEFRFVESIQAVVLAGPGATLPDAVVKSSGEGQDARHGNGKLLIGIGQ